MNSQRTENNSKTNLKTNNMKNSIKIGDNLGCLTPQTLIKEIENTLKDLQEQRKYIALSLRPPIGDTTIQKEAVNRMFINKGRQGTFKNVSEAFYDEMVKKYDSRENNSI